MNTSTELNYVSVDFDPFADGEIQLTAPATESQKEIWASAQIEDDANRAFNFSFYLDIKGNLDLEIFKQAVNTVIERHETLRTNFTPDGSNLLISPSLEIDIPLINLSNLTSKEKKLQIEEQQKIASNEIFNLEKDPLFRGTILKLETTKYFVIFTIHHIICDGWSWWILLTELGKIYSALQKGIVPVLDDPESFCEYALEEEEKASQTSRKEAEKFWLKQFSQTVPIVDFPTDIPRPPFRTFNSNRCDRTLSPEVIEKLKNLGIKQGSSLMSTLLAAFEAFLYRMTGLNELTVGVPTSGQAFSGKYNLMGHCVNLLPMRASLKGSQTFSEYVKIRKSEILDAYDHQELTFGSLLQKLHIPRDASRIPLVPILFNVQDIESESFTFDNLEVEGGFSPRYYDTFEIVINVVIFGKKVVLQCQYNTHLFDAETFQSRLAEFEQLLTSMVEYPDLIIDQLPLLPQSEKDLLETWNQRTKGDYPALCLHQLFEKQVTQTPENIAVIFEQEKLTYQQLNEKANQLAIYLQTLGIKPDDKVGIYIERSLWMLIGLLGILKSGACYIPIDPNFPPERINLMIEDSQLSILITQATLKSNLPQFQQQIELISLAQDWTKIAKIAHTNTLITDQVKPENLAYIIYTSGSTGKPKGVQLQHHNVVNFLTAMQKEPGLSKEDILLALTTISFDIAVLELYLPLTVGACVVIANSETTKDAQQLKQLLSQSQATTVQATPATWQMLLEIGWQGDPNLKIFCGGESLPPPLISQLLDKCSCFWNLYGPTETTVWSTTCQITSANYPISIGKPILNTQIYILDQNLQLLPLGVAGELYIGGDGVARGYFNRPELNQERFIKNHFSDDPQARLYKTGDIARWLPNGNIECLGRSDYQVKVRGFRIELGEIDATLSQYPQIQKVVTTVYEDKTGLKSLVGYYVPQKEISIDEQSKFNTEIRQYLSAKLPAYMIPSFFIKLDRLPLTPNGKIDRKALPKPDQIHQELTLNFIAPCNETESKIAEIWQEILHLEKVSIKQDFFELGGHSLFATKVLAKICQNFQIEISLRNFFEAPTIEKLGIFIDNITWAKKQLFNEQEDIADDFILEI